MHDMKDTTLAVSANPSHRDLKVLEDRLTAFNDSDVGPAPKKPLAVFVHDDSGNLIGGISGYTAWGWLYVQWLWVDGRQRGKRMAARMLDAAETEATARGCHGALIDTFSPAAARAYERQGYKPFGILPDFPVGRSRIYLQKPLPQS